MNLSLPVAALTGFLATMAVGATYHVAGDGDDGHAGTIPTAAWRTLERASNQGLSAGDHLLLRGGDTFHGALLVDGRGEGGSPAQPIVIGSFGHGRAIIVASATAVEVRSTPGIVVRDLVVRGLRLDGNATPGSAGVRVVNALPGARMLSFVRIENVDASGFGEAGIAVATETPDGTKSGFEDVEIVRCTAHGNVTNGIRVAGTFDPGATSYAHRGVIIRDCRAWGNTGDPEYATNWSGNGILIDDVNGALIERCEAWDNGALCHSEIGGPVGIWATVSTRVVIQYCHSHHNRTGRGRDGGGFDFDGGVTHSLMQYNLSHDNDGPGYMLYTYPGAPHGFHHNTIRYCISRNDARKANYGVYASIYVGHHGNATGVHELEIYGNVIEGSPTAEGAKPALVHVFSARDVRLEHNIFLAHGGVPHFDARPDQPGLVFSENLQPTPRSETPLRLEGLKRDEG